MAIRINKIDKGDIVKINEDSPNATSYYALWYKEFPVLDINEKGKTAIIEHCGEHCIISFDDLKFLKEEDVEKAKKGMMVADNKKKIEDMSLEEADDYMGIWHNEKATFMFPKDMIYIWFYDSKDGIEKLFKKDEYDPMLFPQGYWGQRTPPLMQVWTKGYAKKVKGAEHVLGIIQAHLEDGNLYIDMMTVRPTYRRNKINSLMVSNLKKEFKPKKVIFVNTTKMGKVFEGSGKYKGGGSIDESKEMANYINTFGFNIDVNSIRPNTNKDWLVQELDKNWNRKTLKDNLTFKEAVRYRTKLAKELKDKGLLQEGEPFGRMSIRRMEKGGGVKSTIDYSKIDTDILMDMGSKLLKDGSKASMDMSFEIMQELQKRTKDKKETGGGLDNDIYGFHKIPIDVSKKNYDEAMMFREKYKLFSNIGIATFLSSPILWRVIDQNEYDIIMRTGKVTGGEFSIKPEREMGPSFTGSRSNAVAFGLAWKKTNRLKGQLYLIGINAEDKEFLNLNMVERFEKQGLKYEVGDYDIHSSLGDSSLGFSVRNVSLKDVNYIYEISDIGQLTDITYDVIKH